MGIHIQDIVWEISIFYSWMNIVRIRFLPNRFANNRILGRLQYSSRWKVHIDQCILCNIGEKYMRNISWDNFGNKTIKCSYSLEVNFCSQLLSNLKPKYKQYFRSNLRDINLGKFLDLLQWVNLCSSIKYKSRSNLYIFYTLIDTFGKSSLSSLKSNHLNNLKLVCIHSYH